MSGRFAPRSTTCSLLRNRANLGSLLRNGGFHLQRSHFHAATEQQPITARTAATPITLRPYQQDCIDLCLDDFSKGRRRQLVSLPVGSGKTVIFANLIRRLPAPTPKANKTLVLCHRAELLHQARKSKLLIFYVKNSFTFSLHFSHSTNESRITCGNRARILNSRSSGRRCNRGICSNNRPYGAREQSD